MSETADAPVLYLVTSSLSLNFLRDQLTVLAARGVPVVVAASIDGDVPALPDGVELTHVGFAREPSPRRDLDTLRELMRLIRQIRPRAVTAATPKAGLLGTLAARLCRVPTRAYVVWGLRFETLTGMRRRVFRGLERLATAAATDVFYNSPSLLDVAEREGAVRRGRGKLLGTGNCVRLDRFTDVPDRAAARKWFGLRADVATIGFIGRLTRDKGIVDLVSAFEDDGDGLQLLLVGDFEDGDPVPPTTRDRIERSEAITHVAWLDDPRIAYAAIDVLVFASLREGLPNVPLEAQCAGVPVVAYRATGTVDAVRDGVGGHVVDVGDRDALWRMVRSLAEDPEQRQAMGARGREFVLREFDPGPCWDELHRLYDDSSA